MRLPNWQSRFAEVIEQKQRDSFAWGKNDCCLFVCDAVEALTGNDPGEPFRGKYDTPLAGARLIRDMGADSMEDVVAAMAAKSGFVEIKPAFAQRGDIGLYQDPKEGPTVGINIGLKFAFLTERGMTYLPMTSMSRAWKVS